jgi:hypothetical protein
MYAVVKIIAESLSQHDEKHAVLIPLSVGKGRKKKKKKHRSRGGSLVFNIKRDTEV